MHLLEKKKLNETKKLKIIIKFSHCASKFETKIYLSFHLSESNITIEYFYCTKTHIVLKIFT
jgi:hypothetical protein